MTKEKYYTEEVFKFLEKVDYYFGANFTVDDIDMIRGAVERINPEYIVTNGASKCVIVPNDKNYVIKIPFTGEGSDEIYDNDDEFREYCSENGFDYEACPYDRYEFENASNSQNDWDYCLREAEIYNSAKDWGINEFFAKTIYIGTFSHHPIYIQEKCDFDIWTPYGKDIEKYNNLECRKEYHKAFCYLDSCFCEAFDCYTNRDWFYCLFTYLKNKKGLTKAYQIINKIAGFLNDEYVSDLHSSNLGVIKKTGKPVFIDYSGFDC